jgi:hypothetical protein
MLQRSTVDEHKIDWMRFRQNLQSRRVFEYYVLHERKPVTVEHF